MSSLNIKARKKARVLAMQAIYQWQITGDDTHNLQAQFLSHADNQDIDRDYFRKVVLGVTSGNDALDEAYKIFLDRDITEITPVELAILRLSSYELKECLETPYKVILNEAIELSKTFGADESHKYINGVLDKVAVSLRPQKL